MVVPDVRKWRLLRTPPLDECRNMAIDEAIFSAVSERVSPPTIRFYTWLSPAISIGYFQDPLKDIDVKECQAMGVGIVRRMTGGRAVLHDKELTYSIACPVDYPGIPGNILETYRFISTCIARALNGIGIEACITPRRRGGDMEIKGSSACFSSPSHYEITVGGCKLVGSAQKRRDGAFLQHGSILLDMDRDMMKRLMPFSGNLGNITCLNNHSPIDMNGLIDSLVDAFEEGLRTSFEVGSLNQRELKLSDEYYYERYTRHSWNLNE